MKAERYLVRTTLRGRENHRVWNGRSPLGIDFPFRWIIEKTASGARVRTLGEPLDVQKRQIVQIAQKDLDAGSRVDLPGHDGHSGSVRISRIHSPRPAYMPADPGIAKEGAKTQLFAFQGIGRTVLQCSAIHSAYVAYSRNRPIFVVYYSPEGFQVRFLLPGLRVKPKGQAPQAVEPGQVMQYPADQFLNSTIIRGRYWWRFNLVTAPAPILEKPVRDEESLWLRRASVWLAAAFALLGLILALIPAPHEEPKQEPEPQVVLFKAPILRSSGEEGTGTTPAAPAFSELVNQEEEKAPAEPARVQEKAPAQKAKGTTAKVDHSQKATQMLREALSGAKQLVARSEHFTPSHSGTSVSKILNEGDSSLAGPTQIRAAGNIGSSKVATTGIGGKGSPNGIPGSKGESGYSSATEKVLGARNLFTAVDISGSKVEEGLTKEEVGAIIHSHMAEIRYCHEAALLRSPKVEGKLLVNFTVLPGGSVGRSAIESSSVREASLGECVLKKLNTWMFPKPKGGVKVTVSYPFLFKVLGRE